MEHWSGDGISNTYRADFVGEAVAQSVTIDAIADPGRRDVTMTTDGQDAIGESVFMVTALTEISSIVDDSGQQGAPLEDVTIIGSDTHWTEGDDDIDIRFEHSDGYVLPVTYYQVISNTQINYVTIEIPSGASLGLYDVIVEVYEIDSPIPDTLIPIERSTGEDTFTVDLPSLWRGPWGRALGVKK